MKHPECTSKALYMCVYSHIPVQLSGDVLRRMRDSPGSDGVKPPPPPSDGHIPPASTFQSKTFSFLTELPYGGRLCCAAHLSVYQEHPAMVNSTSDQILQNDHTVQPTPQLTLKPSERQDVFQLHCISLHQIQLCVPYTLTDEIIIKIKVNSTAVSFFRLISIQRTEYST